MPHIVNLGISDTLIYKELADSFVGEMMIFCREGTTRKGRKGIKALRRKGVRAKGLKDCRLNSSTDSDLLFLNNIDPRITQSSKLRIIFICLFPCIETRDNHPVVIPFLNNLSRQHKFRSDPSPGTQSF